MKVLLLPLLRPPHRTCRGRWERGNDVAEREAQLVSKSERLFCRDAVVLGEKSSLRAGVALSRTYPVVKLAVSSGQFALMKEMKQEEEEKEKGYEIPTCRVPNFFSFYAAPLFSSREENHSVGIRI